MTSFEVEPWPLAANSIVSTTATSSTISFGHKRLCGMEPVRVASANWTLTATRGRRVNRLIVDWVLRYSVEALMVSWHRRNSPVRIDSLCCASKPRVSTIRAAVSSAAPNILFPPNTTSLTFNLSFNRLKIRRPSSFYCLNLLVSIVCSSIFSLFSQSFYGQLENGMEKEEILVRLFLFTYEYIQKEV